MIKAVKNTSTVIYFTGRELATIANPYFLFVFTHRLTNEKVIINVANTSTNDRVDKATITINGTPGMWSYKVYQKATGSDETESGTIVETGYLNLTETTTGPTEYDEQSNDFIAYDGS
jgi:hypothetical protein